MSKPVVFFGSSVEGLSLLDELRDGLSHVAYHKPWAANFPPGSQTLTALRKAAQESDFAVFIFGPDDWTESRSVKQQAPRDNVVFEVGLFGGIIGFDRVFILHEKGVKCPSDLKGFTCLKYDRNEKTKYQAQGAIPKIRKRIRDEGQRCSRLDGIWWQFRIGSQEKHEKSNLSLLKIESRPGLTPKITGKAWTSEGILVSHFESKAASWLVDPPGLFYYWEGDWPFDDGTPKYHGRGEIILKSAERASGWYTTESDDEPVNEKHNVEYMRATPEDLQTANGLDQEKRALLINERLNNRPPLSL